MGNLAAVKTTEWALEEWARWAYHRRGVKLDYPGVESVARMRGSSVPEPCLTDQEGMLLDGLVSELRARYPEEGEAVALYYLVDRRHYKIAQLMRAIPRKRVSRLLNAGIMWLDGRLKA